MAKKYLDFMVSANDAEEGLEEGKKYFIVFEEYHDQAYDTCIGIFTDLDAAIECGKIHDDRKEVVMVADYKDYTDGSFDPLWVSKIKAKMVAKISKYVAESGYEYTTEYDSYDFDYRPDSFSWENVDSTWTDELIENEPEDVDYKVWYEIVDNSGDVLNKSEEFFVRGWEENNMKRIKIRVSEYNEVDPRELQRLADLGAELIKDDSNIGVNLLVWFGKKCAYSNDSIIINNVTLPLSNGNEEYYTRIIEV